MPSVDKLLTLVQAEDVANAVINKVKNKGYAVASDLGALASKDEVEKTDLASALATELDGKADTSDLGALASKDEVAETDLASALATKINGKADAATTLAGYGITDAYTKTETDNAISEAQSSVLKPGGSIDEEGIVASLLVAGNLGKVYNVTEDFTTTSDFVEGSEHDYPAGTNIYVVDVSATDTPSYKFDVLAGEYGVATQTGNGLMSATDKVKLDNADITAYTGTGAIDVTNHVISVAAAVASTSGTGGNAGTMSASDKEKLDNADVTAYTGSGAIDITNHVVSVAAATASTSGVGGNAGTMSAADKEKLDGADVTAYTGSGAISVSNHQISVAAATASASGVGGNAGTISAADQEKLDSFTIATSSEVEDMIEGLDSL